LKLSKEAQGKMVEFRNLQKNQYKSGTSDHEEHNENSDIWGCLFQPFSEGDWSDKKVLDFGCGQGRNIQNILEAHNIGEVHGCDISDKNIEDCRERFKEESKCSFFVSDGVSISQDVEDIADPLEKEGRNSGYDGIFSTIVMQHISNHDVRQYIFESMFERLNSGGIISIQMGFGTPDQYKNRKIDVVKDLELHALLDPHTGEQFTELNCWDARTYDYYSTRNFFYRNIADEDDINNTNGFCDVRVTDPQQLADTLENAVGFVDFDYEIRDSFSDLNHPHWIYFTARKP